MSPRSSTQVVPNSTPANQQQPKKHPIPGRPQHLRNPEIAPRKPSALELAGKSGAKRGTRARGKLIIYQITQSITPREGVPYTRGVQQADYRLINARNFRGRPSPLAADAALHLAAKRAHARERRICRLRAYTAAAHVTRGRGREIYTALAGTRYIPGVTRALYEPRQIASARNCGRPPLQSFNMRPPPSARRGI